MRRLLLLLVAVLLVGVVPVSADAHDELVECTNPQGLEVITRDGLQTDIETPSFLVGNELESKDILVDFSPATKDLQGNLNVVMTWDIQANDYDLFVSTSMDYVETEDYQPVEPPVETAFVRARHCEVIEVGAFDWLAPVVIDELALDITASAPIVVGSTGD